MQFLNWHYSFGVEYYIKSWRSNVAWIHHYFSLPLLVSTLFAPWKRLVIVDKKPGFDLSRWFETVSYNTVSRLIGFLTRLVLIFVALLTLLIAFIGGFIGFLFWLALPFMSFAVYQKWKRQPKIFAKTLLEDLKGQKDKFLQKIFSNEAGRFVVSHVGVNYKDLEENADISKVSFEGVNADSFEDIITHLIKSKIWSEEFFNQREVEPEDFILAASLWDKKTKQKTKLISPSLGRPGIARELTYGYTPTLNLYSRDLSFESNSHKLIGRENLIERFERILSSGMNIILSGPPGVGKKTIVLEFARRAITGELGPNMSYKRVLEFDYNAILAKNIDLNSKKAEMRQILMEAAVAGNIILLIKDLHRLTSLEVEGYDFADMLESLFEKKSLMMIVMETNADYEKYIAPNLRIRKFFEKVEVIPPTKVQSMEILLEAAMELEDKVGILITLPSLRFMLDESDGLITDLPYPERVLELLDSVITYCQQKGKKIVEVSDVAYVLSEKTGISFTALTEGEKRRLDNIEEIIHKRLIGQNLAINLIGKTLRAKMLGVVKDNRPMGSFLFLGPTGVGKTETAKVLAKVYYGSEDAMIRFDMAEYSGMEGFERLFGSFIKNQPGILTTAIRNRPASLLLLDELEKASREIFNLFLAMLDEGVITDAFGKKVDCRHVFVIGTSNAGAEYIRQLVSQGVSGEDLQKSVIDYVLKANIFAPEFVNRFDGVVVYEPLEPEQLIKIARIMLNDFAQNLKKKNIYLEITDSAVKKLAELGYDPAFGARPMRRIVNLVIGDIISKAILSGQMAPGEKVRILADNYVDEPFVIEKLG